MLLAFSSVLITSCYQDYGLTSSDYDIVATFKEDANDFQSYKTDGATFAISPTIKRLSDNVGGIVDEPGPYDDEILSEIERQMIANGYIEIDSASLPDVYISVGATSSTNVVYYPGYWWGYYGWYYPYGGYGGYAYSYTTGSLFVTMVDLNKHDYDNKIAGVVWLGAINGLLEDTNANTLTRVISSIDKMFEQSPYLKIIE